MRFVIESPLNILESASARSKPRLKWLIFALTSVSISSGTLFACAAALLMLRSKLRMFAYILATKLSTLSIHSPLFIYLFLTIYFLQPFIHISNLFLTDMFIPLFVNPFIVFDPLFVLIDQFALLINVAFLRLDIRTIIHT